MNWRGAVFGCALVLLPTLASAEIKTRVRADGTIEVFNDGPSVGVALGSRPLQLRPVPQPLWSEWIRSHASSHGLDPRLVQALMQAESGYNPRAVSRKGAIGLMQLMPATARELAVPDPFNPEQNIRGGVTYLRRMLDLFGGRVELALAAYNAGPGAVQRHRGIPPYAETRQYVQRVLGLYRGTGLLVGLSANGGMARPHALARNAAPSPLQRALVAGNARRGKPTAVTAAALPATAPPAAAPPRPRSVPAARLATATDQRPTMAAVTAGGG